MKRAVIRSFLLLLLAASFLAANDLRGAAIASGDGQLSVTLDPDGTYQVTNAVSGWLLAGKLPGAAEKIFSARAKDAIGPYERLTFTYADSGRPMAGAIRVYQTKGLVLFQETSIRASEEPPSPFPNFTTIPPALYPFSFREEAFAPPIFGLVETSEPWLLFDGQDQAMVISPASHFLPAQMVGDGRNDLASGFNPQLKNLPPGFSHRTLLAFAHGINQAWDLWGQAMTDLQGKKRPANDADDILKYYGYWTDNGAAYWYNYDREKGYAKTLQSVADTYRREGTPLRYMQLDSWWYQKSLTNFDGKPMRPQNSKLPEGSWNRYGGTLQYHAHPFVFPQGLAAFHEETGLPFITHNRWTDPNSPYHELYKFSGLAGVDPGFWAEIATYLKESGVVTYEQDWISAIFDYSPELSSTVGEGDAFLDNMATAFQQRGLDMQYCMALPRVFLQGSKYGNLTTIRVSNDRFVPGNYHDFLYTSRLAFSLGIWPWCDTYNSGETSNLLLDVLSAGPVGTGDALGRENKANILKAVRTDGVIVKPDVPLLPTDSAYLAEATKQNVPLLAATYTDHAGIKTVYGVALNLSKTGADTLSVNPMDVGCAGPVYLYNYFAKTATRVEKDAPLPIQLAGSPLVYFVAAPVGSSGIAFLGDENKLVGTGKKRISSLQDADGKLSVEVDFAENDPPVTLHGYAASEPRISIQSGQAEPMQFDAATGHFSVVVKPDSSVPVTMEGGDPVRKANLILTSSLP